MTDPSQSKGNPLPIPGEKDLIKSQLDQAVALYMGGHLQPALSKLHELEQADPNNSAIALNIGNVLFQLQNYDESRHYWEKALTLDPLEQNAYLNLGNLHFRENRIQMAIHYWELFKKLSRKNATVWLNLGIAYDKLAEPDKALAHYSVFLGLSPTSKEATQLKLRFDQAKRVFENNIRQADIYIKNGNLGSAQGILKDALLNYPGTPKIYKTYASILYQLGDFQQSLHYYQKALNSDQPDPTVLINLGVIFEKLNKPIDALWAYYEAIHIPSGQEGKLKERYIKLKTEHGHELPAYIEHTRSFLRQQRLETAHEHAQRLVVIANDFSEYKDTIHELAETIEEALDPAVKAAKTYLNMGKDAKAQGKFDQALTLYHRFLAVRPSGPTADAVKEEIAEIKDLMGKAVSALLKSERIPPPAL